MKKILVTGGCGFIGSHLTKKLSQNYDVTVLDNLSRANPVFDSDKAKYRFLDVQRLLEIDERFDVIYHLAAVSSISESYLDIKKTFDVNINGTRIVLEKASRDGSKVVFASTCVVQSTLNHSPYSISKCAAEKLCDVYKDTKNVDVTRCIIHNVYGPGDNKGIIHQFSKRLLEHEPVVIYGSGENYRNYIHVEDVAERLESVLTSQLDQVSIGTGDFWSPNKIADFLGVNKIYEQERPGENFSIKSVEFKVHSSMGYHTLGEYLVRLKKEIDNEINSEIPF